MPTLRRRWALCSGIIPTRPSRNGWINKQRRQVYHLPPHAFYWGRKKMRSLHDLLQGDMIQCASGLVRQIFIVAGALLIPQHGDGVGFGGVGFGKRSDQRQPVKILPGLTKVEIPAAGYGVIQSAQPHPQEFAVQRTVHGGVQFRQARRVHIEKLPGVPLHKSTAEENIGPLPDGQQQVPHRIAVWPQRHAVGGDQVQAQLPDLLALGSIIQPFGGVEGLLHIRRVGASVVVPLTGKRRAVLPQHPSGSLIHTHPLLSWNSVAR